jgi:hypothetical protein
MAKGHQRRQRRPVRFAFFLLLLLAAAAAAGWLVMALWNAVLVQALGANPLGYWQALGLLLLCRVLFGNWGPRRMGPPVGMRGPDAPDGPGVLRDKWASMSPEQRTRWAAHWKSRCAPPDEATAAQRPDDSASA